MIWGRHERRILSKTIAGLPNRNFSIVLELSCLPVGHWKQDRMLCVGWAIVSRVSRDKCGVKKNIQQTKRKYGWNSNRKCRFLMFSVTVFNFWILLWQYLSRQTLKHDFRLFSVCVCLTAKSNILQLEI